jgi:DNA-binding NtrC family response regulator
MADILVVDDNQHMRRLVERILTAAGHTVTEARDGSEGVAVFRRAPPAMVITDIVMVDGEGIETIRALRREAPAMPILAMSGSGTHYLHMAGRLGASATIEKPFRPHDFSTTVDRVLAETTANR